jgi:hypothetical protein
LLLRRGFEKWLAPQNDCAWLFLGQSFFDIFNKELNKDYEEKQKYENLKYSLIKKPTKAFNFLDKTDFCELKERIKETDLMLEKKSEAILRGLNLNPLEIGGREIHCEDRVLNKFKFVLNNAKRKVWPGMEEIREMEKTKKIQEIETVRRD